jgi:hypothetical protein
MKMPAPPSPPSRSLGDRLRGWVLRHKLVSAVIVVVAVLTFVGAIADAVSGPEAAHGSTSVTTSPSDSSSLSPSATAEVPRVQGLSVQTARSRLEQAGFVVNVTKTYSHKVPGIVISASDAAGSTVAVGGTVSITVAQAFPTVPDVVGLSLATAKLKLKAAGYSVVVKKQGSSNKAGIVLSTNPPGGAERLPGKSVTVVIAKPIVITPPPPSCDPNYSGGCVPIASDVDCAGGSGNGPAYVEGPVTVVGSDIYGLDSDGDGIGCE